MRAMQFRIVAALAASAALGGCVGYGYPGDGSYSGYPGYGGSQSYPGSGSARTFRCESQDNRTQHCNADTRYGVNLSRQLSDSPCVQGSTWGYDASGVWVSRGCRAEFTAGGYGSPSYPGGGYGQGRTVRCESQDNHQRRCNVTVYQGVQLQRKLSDSPCNQGYSWGWDRNGIWVDRGCRADFLVY